MGWWVRTSLATAALGSAIVLLWAAAAPPWVAVVVAVVAAVLAGWSMLTIAEPDRRSIVRTAWASFATTLLTTWGLAVFLTASYELLSDERDRTFQVAMLLGLNVGGLLALLRSTRTRAETGASLREQISLRASALSVPIVERGIDALSASTVEELVEVMTQMLRLAVALPLAPRHIDNAELWLRDEDHERWFIVASSTGVDLGAEQPFPQRASGRAGVLSTYASEDAPPHPDCWASHQRNRPTGGDAKVFLCRAGLPTHPWHLSLAGHSEPRWQGTAIVLLEDDRRAIVGALTLATRRNNVIPLAGQARTELVDTLRLWSQTFGIPLRRLVELRGAP